MNDSKKSSPFDCAQGRQLRLRRQRGACPEMSRNVPAGKCDNSLSLQPKLEKLKPTGDRGSLWRRFFVSRTPQRLAILLGHLDVLERRFFAAGEFFHLERGGFTGLVAHAGEKL